jgi:ATP-binding protein involved in chromosome partitioning
MAQKTNMRVLGVVENMTSEVFGAGGGAALAAAIGAPLLGTVPLDARLRECGDAGEPVVWASPDCDAARAIVAVAEKIKLRGGSGFIKSLPLVS